MSDEPLSGTPQVLLVDLPGGCEAELRKLGLSVRSGTFGIPYPVETSDTWYPLVAEPDLVGYNESDIIVVDLACPPPQTLTADGSHVTPGVKGWWANWQYGIVDPRPRAMDEVQQQTLRIFERQGGVIVFADASPPASFKWGYTSGGRVHLSDSIAKDNWSFIPWQLRKRYWVRDESGTWVRIRPETGPLGGVLGRHLGGIRFSCYFGSQDVNWTELAVNKNEDPVSGLLLPRNARGDTTGFLLLLPQVSDKAAFLKDLFQEALPDLFPHLFPNAAELRWTQRPEYEQAEVLAMREEIRRVRDETEKTMAGLEGSLEEARRKYWYLDDVLTGTDAKLVKAVAECLHVMGFDVTDSDAEVAGRPKREDLRIQGEPLLLVEVKGVGGLPADAEAHQSFGYIAPTMQELNRYDVQALSIINHQRHVPPLERNNAKPFRDDIIANAEHHKFGLLTAWDLYRLTRSFIENGWQHEDVRDLFYRPGRVDPVPTHYKFLGAVADGAVFEDGRLAGFVTEAEVSIGDRIAFELPTRLREQDVTSIHVDRQSVERATPGVEVCIETVLTKDEARKGVRVFRVRK